MFKHKREIIIMLFLLNIIFTQNIFFGDSLEDLTEQQDSLEEDLDVTADNIEEVNQSIEENSQKISELNTEIAAVETSMTSLEESIAANEDTVEETTEQLGNLLVYTQLTSNNNLLISILSEEDYSESVSTFYAISLIEDNINESIASLSNELAIYEDQKRELVSLEASLDDKNTELVTAQNELDAQVLALEENSDEIKADLAQVEDDILEYTSVNADISSDKEEIMSEAGISEDDYFYVDYIVTRESSWNYTATNSVSGAYGLCQSLPGTKMESAGSDWQTNPITQMIWCDGYAQERYGSWESAYEFWISNHWW